MPDALAAARFWARVDKSGPVPAHRPQLGRCWPWKGKLRSDGYGRATVSSRTTVLAHRAAWELVNGPVPVGACVLHRCDNRACQRAEANPAASHLFLGDRGDNARDMASKGRAHLQRDPRAFAGDKHWTRRRPELLHRKGTRPCSNCQAPTNPLRRGRCEPCAKYFRKHGAERPRHPFAA